jgi:hypothetical protein
MNKSMNIDMDMDIEMDMVIDINLCGYRISNLGWNVCGISGCTFI